jgi:hypothetical protein
MKFKKNLLLTTEPSQPIFAEMILKYKTKSFKMKKKIDEKRAITPRWVIKFT